MNKTYIRELEPLRNQLKQQVEDFLKNGGKIQKLNHAATATNRPTYGRTKELK